MSDHASNDASSEQQTASKAFEFDGNMFGASDAILQDDGDSDDGTPPEEYEFDDFDNDEVTPYVTPRETAPSLQVDEKEQAYDYFNYNTDILANDEICEDDSAIEYPSAEVAPTNAKVTPFNNIAASMIASQLDDLIDTRISTALDILKDTPPESSRSDVPTENYMQDAEDEEAAMVRQIKEKVEADARESLRKEYGTAAGSALSAVRSRSSGGQGIEGESTLEGSRSGSRGSGIPRLASGNDGLNIPSEKALKSFENENRVIKKRSVRRSQSKDDEQGLEESTKKDTLRALRKRREDKEMLRKGINKHITVEGEEENVKVETSSQKIAKVLRADRSEGPVVRQLKRTLNKQNASPKEEEKIETEEEKAARRAANKERKSKMNAMLAALQQQKAKEMELKQKKENSIRKRQALLTARVIAEGNERKLMCLEDKERYRSTAMEKSSRTRAALMEEKQREEDEKKKKSSKKMSQENSDAIYNRLSARHQMTKDGVDLAAQQTAPARDFNDWKRKNNVPQEGQVFAMTGWYPCVKEALLSRGWYFNSDPQSPFFDLKWTLRSLETDQEQLQSWQLTNHFMKNIAITTKVGLIRSLQSLVWLADVSNNDVIPRGYDLSTNDDMQAFIDDFRCGQAELILKKLYKSATGISFPPQDIEGTGYSSTPNTARDDDGDDDEDDEDDDDDEIDESDKEEFEDKKEKKEKKNEDQVEGPAAATSPTTSKPAVPLVDQLSVQQVIDEERSSQEKLKLIPKTPRVVDMVIDAPGEIAQELEINEGVFETCCCVLERYIRPSNESYLDAPMNDPKFMDAIDAYHVMSALQWEVITNYDIHASHTLHDIPMESVDGFLRKTEEELASRGALKQSNSSSKEEKQKSVAQQQRLQKKKEATMKHLREDMTVNLTKMRKLTQQDVSRIHKLLNFLYKQDPTQASLNGSGDVAKNIWIVKPGAKSRGRGIMTFSDLPKLLKYVDAGTGSAQSAQWVVQKYMENPLCIGKHKFDLRQWVLVTDWNPLTIYFYDECYARFSVEQYTTADSDMENSYVHLVNNSISKNSEEFKKKLLAENGEEIEGFMWGHRSFKEWIEYSAGEDLMKKKITPRMKDIVKWSLMCASECIEHRKNSWELYGFDFMVDDNYNAWLIEINSSPACDYSTPITERYVKKALVELLSVVLDMRKWENTKSKKKRGKKPNTGGWQCIHKGEQFDMPTAAFGIDMAVRGDACKLPKKKPTLPTYSLNSSSGYGQYSQKRRPSAENLADLGAVATEKNPYVYGGPTKPQPPSILRSNKTSQPFARSSRKNRATVKRSNSDDMDNSSLDEGSLTDSLLDEASITDIPPPKNENVKDFININKMAGRGAMTDSLNSLLNDSVDFDDSMDSAGITTTRLTGSPIRTNNDRQAAIKTSPIRKGQQTIGNTMVGDMFTNAMQTMPKVTRALLDLPQAPQINNGKVINMNIMNPDMVLEMERKENITRQQEKKNQRAQHAKAAKPEAVPPVGRNAQALKAKVFDLPF
jgi:hypothetical protein